MRTTNSWKVEKDKALLKILCPKGVFSVTVDLEMLSELAQNTWTIGRRGHVVCRKGAMARIVVGAPPGKRVWHKNGNHMDNRSGNLTFERPKLRQRDQKRVGISFDKGREKYRAYATKDGVRHWLGWFDDYDEAEDVLDSFNLIM